MPRRPALLLPYRKIVVTNDEGKFVVPDLPKGDYQVWVRGYGLKDSAPVKGSLRVGIMKLTVSDASSPQEAAKVYPASYWLCYWRGKVSDLGSAEFQDRFTCRRGTAISRKPLQLLSEALPRIEFPAGYESMHCRELLKMAMATASLAAVGNGFRAQAAAEGPMPSHVATQRFLG